MANTYTQFHVQFIFSPKYRAALIKSQWESDLYKYITGIVQNNKHKMISINGMPDHVHMLIGLHPSQSISDLMRDVKASSSGWINKNRLTGSRFEWQAGYGGFSYSKSQLPKIIDYIINQKEHHRKKSFMEEYCSFLKEFKVEYDERYVFKDPE